MEQGLIEKDKKKSMLFKKLYMHVVSFEFKALFCIFLP